MLGRIRKFFGFDVRRVPHKRWRSWTGLAIERLEDRLVPASFTYTVPAGDVSNIGSGASGGLVWAVNQANTDRHTGADVIKLTYDASTPYEFNAAASKTAPDGPSALPIVNSAITIQGGGAVLQRGTSAGAFRFFEVSANGSLTLGSLALQNGLAQGSGAAAQGGAIYNAGALVLSGVDVAGNQALGDWGKPAFGGGIYSAGGAVALLSGTSLTGNVAQGGGNGENINTRAGAAGGDAKGGGLYVAGGTVSLSSATLSSNAAQGGKGATTLNANSGGGGKAEGGGLYLASGNATFADAIARDNSAVGGNGGSNVGALTFTSGGGRFTAGGGGLAAGGGLYLAAGALRVNDSTFTANQVSGGQAGMSGGVRGVGGDGSGGAVFLGGGTAQVVGSTINANNAQGQDAVGGGVYAVNETLGLTHAAVNSNSAQAAKGSAGMGAGGGLYLSGGSVNVQQGSIDFNNAVGGSGYAAPPLVTFATGATVAAENGGAGGPGSGGGLYLLGGMVSLAGTTVTSNSAEGGTGGSGGAVPSGNILDFLIGGGGGAGGTGMGGGLYVNNGAVYLAGAALNANRAQGGLGGSGGNGPLDPLTGRVRGGAGGSGGLAAGGGAFADGGVLNLTDTPISANQVRGGAGGVGGQGAPQYVAGPVSNPTAGGIPSSGGPGGAGGPGGGGGLYLANGALALASVTLGNNQAFGGAGGAGGFGGGVGGAGNQASGGGLYVAGGNASAFNSTVAANLAQAGNGGNGGNGERALISTGRTFLAAAGAAGAPGATTSGGGLYATGGALSLTSDTIAFNHLLAGSPGVIGIGSPPGPPGGGSTTNLNGAGVFVGIAVMPVDVVDSIIADNTIFNLFFTASDVYGGLALSDYDLIGFLADSSVVSGSTGDIINVDAGLDPNGLQANGGATETIALRPGSRAIDAGDYVNAPAATDQRGHSRIVNGRIDIGAVEFGAAPANGHLLVSISGPTTAGPGTAVSYRIKVSNLSASAQTDVTLVDSLPAEVASPSFTAPPNWSTGAAAGLVSAYIGSLAANTSATFTLTVTLTAQDSTGPVLSDTASVGPVTGDSNPADNTATVLTSVTSLAPAKIAYVISPSNGIAGQPLATVQVAVESSDGSVIPRDNSDVVTLSVVGGAFAAGSTTSAIVVNGVATFRNLVLGSDGAFKLHAVSGSFTATSTALTIQTPTHLVFLKRAAGDSAGVLGLVRVAIVDATGKIVSADNTDSVTVGVATGPANFTLQSITTVTTVDGIAAFDNLELDTVGSYMLRAASAGLTGAVSMPIAVAPAAAAQIVFKKTPVGATAGKNLGTVQVAVEDRYGNFVASSNIRSVSLSSGGGAPGNFANGTTVTATVLRGIATFSNLVLDTAGTYNFTAWAPGLLAGLTAVSPPILIVPQPANHVAFLQVPTFGDAANPLTPVEVAVEDRFNNIETGDNADTITIALASGAPGKLTAGSTVKATVVNGLATFTNLVLDAVGTYHLITSASGLPSVVSAAITVQGNVSALTITGLPSTIPAGQTLRAVSVAVKGAAGIITTDYSDVITLTISGGSAGAPTTTTRTSKVVAGIATFSNIACYLSGSFQVTASSAGFTATAQATLTVNPVDVSPSFLIAPSRGNLRPYAGMVPLAVTVTLAPRVAPIYGPLALVFTNLPDGVTVQTYSVRPTIVPTTSTLGTYRDLRVEAGQQLSVVYTQTLNFYLSVSRTLSGWNEMKDLRIYEGF